MDIFNLKRSKTREKILKHYFANPEKKYYLRELERILSLSVGNIRRELLALEKSGLFKRGEMGNQVYYYLNTASPLSKDFKNILPKIFNKRGNKEKKLKDNLIIIEKSDFDNLNSRVAELENMLNNIVAVKTSSTQKDKEKITRKIKKFIPQIM